MLPELIRSGVSFAEDRRPAEVAGIRGEHHARLSPGAGRGSQIAGDTIPALRKRSRHGRGEIRRYELEMGFSRGLYTGWFRGINNQELVHARFGKKRGVFLGEVKRIRATKRGAGA